MDNPKLYLHYVFNAFHPNRNLFNPISTNFIRNKINIHLDPGISCFLHCIRYYLWLRKMSNDTISSQNGLSIILGAILEP